VKRIIAVGRIVDGRVTITRPTLDEQIAINEAQIARNREIIAMHRDMDALLAGKPVGYRLTAAQLAQLDDENPGLDYSTQPWKW